MPSTRYPGRKEVKSLSLVGGWNGRVCATDSNWNFPNMANVITSYTTSRLASTPTEGNQVLNYDVGTTDDEVSFSSSLMTLDQLSYSTDDSDVNDKDELVKG